MKHHEGLNCRPMNETASPFENAVLPGLLRRLAAMFYDTFLVLALVVVAFTLVYLPLAMAFGLENLQEHPILRTFTPLLG